jgi:tetratricopeptide (TPR) repeat protein
MIKIKKTTFISAALLLAVLFSGCDSGKKPYEAAEALMSGGRYPEAAAAFEALGDYKDAASRAKGAREAILSEAYQAAEALFREEEYEQAAAAFGALGDYKDAASRAAGARDTARTEDAYQTASGLMETEDYETATGILEGIGDYKDSAGLLEQARAMAEREAEYSAAVSLMDQGEFGKAAKIFEALDFYKDSWDLMFKAYELNDELIINNNIYDNAAASLKKGDYEAAISGFEELEGFKDAASRLDEARAALEEARAAVKEAENTKKEKDYQDAFEYMEKGSYDTAIRWFRDLGDYKDAPGLLKEAEDKLTESELTYEKLKYDPKAVKQFKPESPNPKYFIVCAGPVKDPVTGEESQGGYDKNYARHNPADAEDVRWYAGSIRDSSLMKTEDPNLATYAMIITFKYVFHGNYFHHSSGAATPKYVGIAKAELYNMVTGKSIFSDEKETYATYVGESVYTSMLDAAEEAGQLYAGPGSFDKDDFKGFDAFIGG